MAVQRDKVIANAEKLVAKGRIEPAIKEYERLLDDNPNDVNTLNRIGDLWVRISRNDEAVSVFTRIADHYSRDGFFLKAIAIYKKINKLDPSKLEIYAKLADLYAKQGLAMEAKSQYQVLADYYLKHGDPPNALAIYRKISELDPNSINVHVKLADLYSQNNQTVEALKEYDRVGRMLLKRGMLDEAVQVFRKALKIDPRNTELVDSLVTALLEAKDYDNARQIVDSALESNPDNPRLLSMLGRVQLGRGDAAGARATLERALAADPGEVSVREALADLYLKENDADRALEMVGPLVERVLGRGERGAAIEMLNRILRVAPGHAPTLERLVALYVRLNEETNILASMNSLAEAHMARSRFEEAAAVLEKLIQREPQNAQHRTKLQFVRSQLGGVDTLPPRPKRPTGAPPPMEIEEPAPSFTIGDDSAPSFSLDLDASRPFELDLSADSGTAAAPPPRPQHLVPAVEVAAADLAAEGDDLDFITEHLTEAEVFAKYGLAEKAAEHLRAVLERSPANVTAHERLFRILLEEGGVESARLAATAYVRVLEASGDTAAIETVRNEFLMRGHTFDVAAARAQPAQPPAPVAEPQITPGDFGETAGEISFDLEGGAGEVELDLESVSFEGDADQALVSPDEITEELTFDEELPMAEEFSVGAEVQTPGDFAEPEELTAAPEELPVAEEVPVPEELSFPEEPIAEETPSAEELPLAEELEEPEDLPAGMFVEAEPGTVEELSETLLDVQEPAIEFGAEPPSEPIGAADEPFFGLEGTADRIDIEELPLEELREIDFYIEQELFEEARQILERLTARFPGNAGLDARRVRLEAAAAPAVSRPAVLSRDEIENELLSAIPDDEDELTLEPAPPPAPPPPPAAPAAERAPAISAHLVHEENLFADEEDFFDLAAELESELAEEEEPISLSEEEQSLEEIFKEFKKGVEQQLDSEDYDTHYNLGIAYKEMGLIDEAIGEFQLASKDPKRAVECASMLGLCFLEKGMPQLAIKWYRKGLEMPEISEDEHIGLLYDLGAAYQEVGDTDNAQRAFMEVYGINSTYRDIVSRIKQLEDARK